MTLTHRTAVRWLAVAAGAGLVLRVAFGLAYWVDKPLTHDEREYLALAASLAEGRGFTYPEPPTAGSAQQFGRAPGYPAFLALIGASRAGYEAAPTRVKIVQASIGAATILLIAACAWRAAGREAGVLAALLAAIYPPLVWICSYVFSETLYAAVALLSAYVLQRALEVSPGGPTRNTLALAAASGVLAGAAILIRPAMIVFVLLAAVWLPARRRLAVAVVLVAAAGAVVAPWTIRNLRTHGRFVLVASEGGVTFWTGNHPLARGEGDLAANPQLKLAEVEFRRRHPGLTADDLEPIYYREALQWIAANPGDWLLLLGKKAFYTVVPIGPSYTLHSRRYWAASVVSYGAVLPFAVVGLRRLWRSAHRPTAVLLLGASAVLVGLVFFPQERFRIPVIDPVLIIAAAAAGSAGSFARPRQAGAAV